MGNVYFELTEAFNEEAPTVALASGQAVVFYGVAIVSKDGDWVIQESQAACDRVLNLLEARGARYRPAAPLDVRWLAGGWSSHFEFQDERGRRVRCDFVSRPPRVAPAIVQQLFTKDAQDRLRTVDVESLILMKRTQRAKDYAAIGTLAMLLPPDREIELTTDPDRIIALATAHGLASTRPAVQAALNDAGRRAVVIALAEEVDTLQLSDKQRIDAYTKAAAAYLAECRRLPLNELAVCEAHQQVCALAERLLPTTVEA